MIVDSSVWIAHQRNTPLPQVQLLRRELQQRGDVYLTASILQEVLQGACNAAQQVRWERSFALLPLLRPADLARSAVQAARLYARCRWQGLTIRSPNDVLAATLALEHQQPLLHADADFYALAKVEPQLQIIPATP